MPPINKDQEALLIDIRDYLLTESSTLLQKLQNLNILPLEPKMLNKAIKLLSTCTALFRVYESSHYENPFTDELLLTSIANAQKNGWKNLYNAYTTGCALSRLTPEEFNSLNTDTKLPKYLKNADARNYVQEGFNQKEFAELKRAIAESTQIDIKNLAAKLVNHSEYNDSQQITAALRDYVKTNFLPRLFRAISNFEPTEPVHQLFAGNWAPDAPIAQWLSDDSELFLHGSLILCQGKDIAHLAAFSTHWNAPTQQAAFNSIHDPIVDVYSWPSLFQSKADSLETVLHKELPLPASIMPGCKFVSLTSYQDLVEEGGKLGHCLGNRRHYLESCRLGNNHYLSLRDVNNNSLLTIGILIDAATKQVSIGQREGLGHCEPSEREESACTWLTQSINDRTLPIDFDYLAQELKKRILTPSLQSKFSRFLGFDPSAEEALRTMKQLKDMYRKHTPKDFIANLHQLSHLVTMELRFQLPGKEPTSKVINLLTDEERLSPEERKARRRLRWTHTVGNPQKAPEHKEPEDNNKLNCSPV